MYNRKLYRMIYKVYWIQNSKKPARRLVCIVSCVCFCHIDCTTSERLLPGKKKTGADGRDRSLSLQRG